ncbi:MAG: 50S ribosomal protein L29 [Candidatus Cardinium sp.]|nr:50S ribosomal protein L29 [Candidatus Cardinium sp.]
MQYKDIQALSYEAGKAKLQETVDYFLKLKFAHAVSPIEQPMKIRQARKLIARLKTAQRAIALRDSYEAVEKQCHVKK